MEIVKHIDLLGQRAKDRVTGFEGVVTSVSFDLYGCIQAVVNPGLDKAGKVQDAHWFDVNRLDLAKSKRVMPVPDFDHGPVAEGKKGPAEKPAFRQP